MAVLVFWEKLTLEQEKQKPSLFKLAMCLITLVAWKKLKHIPRLVVISTDVIGTFMTGLLNRWSLVEVIQ